MARKETIKGRDLMLFERTGEEQSYTYKAFGAALTHTLNITREEVDVSSKDTGEWGDSIPGLLSWEMTANHTMVLEDYDSLVDRMIKGEKLVLAFAPKSTPGDPGEMPEGGWTVGTGGWEGEVLIASISNSAPHNDKATYDVTFKGKGPLKKRE